MTMNYDVPDAQGRAGWIVEETAFSPDTQGKCEAIMCIGNGYLGARSATEESYVGQVRNTFIAGTFNQFHDSEVTELPNAPDVLAMDIRVGGDRLSLVAGKVDRYSRRLNLANGEVAREFEWTSPNGYRLAFEFRRFASMHDRHLVCTRTSIKLLDGEAKVGVVSGIDGQQTNSGTQHFVEGERRIYDGRILEYVSKTSESDLDFVVHVSHRYSVVGSDAVPTQAPRLERRQVLVDIAAPLRAGDELVIEKQARFHTSYDLKFQGIESLAAMREQVTAISQATAVDSYEDLLERSSAVWAGVWDSIDVRIDGRDFDQLAVRFAMYHMTIYTPNNDARIGIAAKGLSGEGYKGHSFWDTEIFILPFLIMSQPEVARRLLEYRYLTLPGARANAKSRGFKGAMYAWESATTGEEVTPEWGAVDIHTGEATRIWSGVIEQHITADIAYAVWNYFRFSGDVEFMESMGYEILFETATFWCSRLEWLEDRQKWGICDVIGPDEYKEHIDNNAFTNYMVGHNIELAIEYYDNLKTTRPEVLEKIQRNVNLSENQQVWRERIAEIYLPQPRPEDGLLPQDDTYLQKKVIDLTPYRQQKHVGQLFRDYSLEQVNEIQVSKQADVIALFWLLGHRFSDEALRTNWSFYEPKTLHDSSLSLSSHSCVAAGLGDATLAYNMFEKASHIDLGPNMKTSDHGIHAAAMGGIWQAVVNGFGGARVKGMNLEINPQLPAGWTRLSYSIYWRGQRLRVTADKDGATVSVEAGSEPVELTVAGEVMVIPARESAHG